MTNIKKLIVYFIMTLECIFLGAYLSKRLHLFSKAKEKIQDKRNDFKNRKYATINK